MKRDTLNIDRVTSQPENRNEETGFPESKDLSGSMKSIMSGIRHEIGNPANTIKITASVLKENIDAYSKDKVLSYIDRIMSEVDRIEELLKKLKTYSLCDELSLMDVSLEPFMKKALSGTRCLLEERHIAIDYSIEPESGSIYTDPSALNMIIQILISNACHALEGVQNPQITMDITRPGHMLRIEFTDNGCGIGEDLHEEIFKPFYSSRRRGTGLGLSIVYKILKRMKGSIRVESQPGKGTSFILHIPGDQDDG